MSNGILIGCAGRARVGKGTFVTLLREIALERTPNQAVIEVAFADALKAELDPILQRKLGISAWTTNTEDKKVIRPYLVERGAGARAADPDHWVKLVTQGVKARLKANDIVVVSDCRYLNEVNWVHSLGGKVVYIERLQSDGTPVPPANEEEAANDGAARQASDLTISWPTVDHIDELRPYVLDAWTQLAQPS